MRLGFDSRSEDFGRIHESFVHHIEFYKGFTGCNWIRWAVARNSAYKKSVCFADQIRLIGDN